MGTLFFFFLASFALLWGAAIAAVWLIRRWFLGRLNVSALLASSSDAIDALLDAKLELLVLLFKQQVPMASTFLVGPLVDRLKGEAHRELMTLLPEIEEVLRDKGGLAASVERQLPTQAQLLLITAAAAMMITLALTALLLLVR